MLEVEHMATGTPPHIPAYPRSSSPRAGQERPAPLQQLPGTALSLQSSHVCSRDRHKVSLSVSAHWETRGHRPHRPTLSAALPSLPGRDGEGAHCDPTGSLSTLVTLHTFGPVRLFSSSVSIRWVVPRASWFPITTNTLGFEHGNEWSTWFKLAEFIRKFPSKLLTNALCNEQYRVQNLTCRMGSVSPKIMSDCPSPMHSPHFTVTTRSTICLLVSPNPFHVLLNA